MAKISDVDLIFGDLTDAFRDLEESKHSPKLLRRNFSNFIQFSQQITEIMRKEYSKIKGQTWEAGKFNGWNHTTELFKKLRREDYHQYPILIQVKERQYIQISEDNPSEFLVAEGTWSLDTPFSEELPDGLQLIDSATGLDIVPHKKEYDFIIYSQTKEISDAISLAGSNNVLVLSRSCFDTLSKYYDYYQMKLNGT